RGRGDRDPGHLPRGGERAFRRHGSAGARTAAHAGTRPRGPAHCVRRSLGMGMSGSTQRVRFRLNGGPVVTEVEPDASLLEVLRDSFSLHGPRESCGQGVCGTCTVAVDGAAVSSCLFWAVLAEGRDVITVEGL